MGWDNRVKLGGGVGHLLPLQIQAVDYLPLSCLVSEEIIGRYYIGDHRQNVHSYFEGPKIKS